MWAYGCSIHQAYLSLNFQNNARQEVKEGLVQQKELFLMTHSSCSYRHTSCMRSDNHFIRSIANILGNGAAQRTRQITHICTHVASLLANTLQLSFTVDAIE